jgi:two-component system chemotaxis sensor kinase CheA
MIILTDITDELRLQEESRRENEKWQMLRKVITNRHPFGLFDREAKRLFSEFVRKEKNFSSLMPALHTVKGNAGFLGFTRTQQSAHILEDTLSNQAALGEDVYPAEEIDDMTNSFSEEMTDVTDTLGPSWRIDVDLVELPKSEFILIENHIKNFCPNPEIIHVIEEHKRKPLSDLLSRFPKMAAQIAERLGKRIMPVKIIGGDISVSVEEFDELIDSFSHIIRNCTDHGIELPIEREQLGKPLSGTIGIEIEESPHEIIFRFSDDGRGIQFDKIEKRARELGFIAPDEKGSTQDFLSIIFWENFSTASIVSNLSGRGVGLSAVRAAVKKMNGHIKVKTWKDHGTIISIIIPKNK